MMTIGSTIPENLLFFKQVEAKAVAGEPGYAQVMAEKIAELTAQKAAHNSAALQRSARAELESATDPTKATVAAAPLQAQVSNPLKPGGQRPSLMSAPLSSDMNTALLAAQEARTSNSTQPTSTTAKQAASSVPSAKEEFLEYAALTPAQRYYRDILNALDLTEEELAALPPEERAKIEELVADKMKERVENSLG